MFVEAFEKAAIFTRPAVVSQRNLNGDVTAGVASFVVLNADGWIVTAAHLCLGLMARQRDQDSIRIHDDEVAAAQLEPDFNRRRNALKKIAGDPSWIRDASIWWSQDGAQFTENYIYPPADIMICRLEGFDVSGITEFPKLRKPDQLKPGMSLLKVGYPFHEIKGRWDETTQGFQFDNAGLTLFPIDGIFTRELAGGAALGLPDPPDYEVKLVQTSSPGLLGQSGGPTLDSSGALCAIQSRTMHIPLGFIPEVQDGKSKIKEHQFINVGVGVHTATLEVLLARHGVPVDWAD